VTDIAFMFEPPFSVATADAMGRSVLLTQQPHPRLAHAVDALWLWQAGTTRTMKERLLPTGTMHLFLDLEKPDLPAAFAGVQTGWSVVDSSRYCIGVHFKPGGAHAFLEGSTGELADGAVPLEMIWGRDASRLREQLHEATTPSAKLDILANALIARQRDDGDDPVVAHALDIFARHPGARVGDVARQTALSRKRFIRVFFDRVGVTPKRYWRIRRFQRVLRHIRRRAPDRWSAVAMRYGYADQAHLIREFRELSGLTPTTYLRAWQSNMEDGKNLQDRQIPD
jgi:AraC-like DNA-binding protein